MKNEDLPKWVECESDEFIPVTLLAISLPDGLAFYKENENGKVYSIRPPWHEPVEVSDGMVGRAVGDHGFVPVDHKFDSFDYMISFISSSCNPGKYSDPDWAYKLIRIAPSTALKRYLDKAEESLSKGQFRGLEKLLCAVLEANRLGDLRERAEALLYLATKDVRKLSEIKQPPRPLTEEDKEEANNAITAPKT